MYNIPDYADPDEEDSVSFDKPEIGELASFVKYSDSKPSASSELVGNSFTSGSSNKYLLFQPGAPAGNYTISFSISDGKLKAR